MIIEIRNRMGEEELESELPLGLSLPFEEVNVSGLLVVQ